jgi:hypothetical protein
MNPAPSVISDVLVHHRARPPRAHQLPCGNQVTLALSHLQQSNVHFTST